MSMSPRLLRPRQSGFNPKSIVGLQLWLDGADSSTITLNGSTVSEWRDKSGNNRHAVQATALRQPAVTASARGGKSAIAFTNDWMTSVHTYALGTIFVVWEHPTTMTGDDFPGIVSSRTSFANKTSSGQTGFNLNVAPTASSIALDPAPSGGSFRLNGATAAAGFTSYTTGQSARTSPDRWNYMSATFTATSGSQAFVLGADAFSATGRLMQNGHIAEVLFYSTALSLANVQTVERYLASRWAIT